MSNRMEREEYWHWFHGLAGISRKEKEDLLERCPDVAEWYVAAEKKQAEELLGPRCDETDSQRIRRKKLVKEVEDKNQREVLKRSYEAIQKTQIRMVCRESKEYPSRLKTMVFPPYMLYYMGELPQEEAPSLAVIGARNCSVYGEEIASGFSRVLGDAGIQIISGMARGIDAAAQRAAINTTGSAYAVLGSGVDVCYPKENKGLYNELVVRGGVISEELPGTAPFSWNFPKRNRIISGLADAVLVIEARENSGSLITVSYALEQGKEIYAVPGRIYEKLTEGTNRLIQEGAYLVMEPEDIIRGFSEKIRAFTSKKGEGKKYFEKKPKLLLASREKIVYACLSLRPKHLEELLEETSFSFQELSELLFDMEMKQYIKQPVKNYFIIQS